MKPQDLIFIVVMAGLLFAGKPKWFAVVGLICLVAAIPLFSLWIFFTAQRLVYYSAGFMLVSIILLLYKSRK